MTFEIFDAALLVPGEGFPATLHMMGAAADGEGLEGSSLQAALRAHGGVEHGAARASELPGAGAGDLFDRRAARAEALVFDLWAERPEARDLRGFDDLARSRLAGGTGLQAWLLQHEDGLALSRGENDGSASAKDSALRAATASPPEPGNYDDANGNGQWDDGETIYVTGQRPRTIDDDSDAEGIPGGDPGGNDQGGGPALPPGDQEQNDCRDRNALAARDEIKADGNSGYKEHGSVVYRDSNGVVRHSSPIEGGWGEIPTAAITQWLNNNGVSFNQVIGFVHNHDPYNYSNAGARNRYPSGGDVQGGDWNAADWFVSNGAGGPGGENFALYIIDTGWRIREFEYKDREFYKDLNGDQRDREVGLPDPLVDDGSACG